MASSIEVTVISQQGHCELAHRPGDRILFTEEGLSGRLCIHALYSLMPKVVAMMYGADFPWLENPDVATHACPDVDNPVVFQLRRINE